MMENSFQQKIVDDIKREPEIEVSDQFTCEDSIVENVKHEPERHFVFIMPDDPEPEVQEVKEMKLTLMKFDRKFKNPAKFFESYFVCDYCDNTFKQLAHLKEHLKICKITQKCNECGLKSKSEIIKECGLCELKFDCDTCKMIHQDHDHFKDSNWHCNKCDFKTFKKLSLKNHRQIHVKKISCATCNQIFARNNQLKNHQQQHRHGVFAVETENKFECRICQRSYATKSGLRNHETAVHSQIKFHCDICGKISKNKTHLQLHMNFHFKIPCQICQHLIAPHRLKEHVDQHSSSTKFKCDACEKVFSTKNNLRIHRRRDHEIDQVQCDLCDKILKNKHLLRVHMRNHLKISCPICRKSTSKDNLKQHMKMHSSGQKSLLCNIKGCRQKFENIKELNDHEESHIGPKNYKCPKCDHHTTKLRDMKDHMRRKSHETKIIK